jgi:hypothetical protein
MFSTAPDRRVAGRLPGMEFPPESRPPQEIERRLGVLDLGRGHQRRQDDAGLPSVHNRVVVVAETRPALAWSQRRGIRIRRAGPDVRRSPVRAARSRAIGPPRCSNPVVAVGGPLGQISERFVAQSDRQTEGLVCSAALIDTGSSVIFVATVAVEELGKVRLDGKPRLKRIERGIGVDIG